MSYQLEMHETFNCSRTLEDVFDYVVDFSRIDQWDHTIISASKTSKGTIGLGTCFAVVVSIGVRKVLVSYQITEFEPPHRAVLTGTSDNFIAIDTVTLSKPKARSKNSSASISSPDCHLDWHASIKFSGLAAKAVPLLSDRIKQSGGKTIRDLKVALEDKFSTPRISRLASLADKLMLPGILSFTKYGYQQAARDWHPVSASIKGKHIVITGATSGLGLAAAEQLAHLGADLTLVARNADKAEQIASRISTQTGNTSIAVEIADLSEIRQVESLANRLLKSGKAIDVLINNAGALLNPRQETNEGIEKSFALLLLSPYQLTERLHPLLKKSGTARVINVSSGGMYAKRISIGNLQSTRGKYTGSDAYARAKRGLVIIGERWAERWAKDGVTVHNMHPGWAYTQGVVVGLPLFTKLTRPVLRSSEEGADTIVWLASATEAAKTTGLFWLDRVPHNTHLTEATRETAKQRDQLELSLQETVKTLVN